MSSSESRSQNEEQDSLITTISKVNNKNYHQDIIIDGDKIRSADFDLTEDHNLRVSNSLTQIVSRLSRKIGWIYISTLQVILKSTFVEGIDSPMRLVLRDDRIIDPTDSIIARGEGNLSNGKIKFDVNIQTGLSLQDKNLDRTITLGYILDRDNFMIEGNHPFSVAYKINYALTNSHHSLTFRKSPRISIDKLFDPVVKLQEPQRFIVLRNLRIENSEEYTGMNSGIRANSAQFQNGVVTMLDYCLFETSL